MSKATDQLSKLLKRTEAGEEVILTRGGRSVAGLVPSAPATTRVARRELMKGVRAAVAAKMLSGAAAAPGQDFLFRNDHGLPV
jgi:antitoxin (DNA-binding transcriptional repressor) of toxin-antitoxin stability system